MYSQRIPTDGPTGAVAEMRGLYTKYPWSNDIITSNVGFLGDSVVEELGLINYTVFCRVGKNLGDVSIKSFFSVTLSAISPNLRCSQAGIGTR